MAASPLLVLHGFLGRGADWRPVVDRLGAEAHPDLLTPDLPGHGRSVGLAPAEYTPDGASDRLVRLLDAASAEAADVVGYSMGGRLALHLALRHPDRVRRLVLVSASPGLRTAAERAARRATDADRAAAIAADLPAFLDAWYRMPLWGGLPDGLRQRLAADRAAHNDAAELGRSLRGMGTGAQPSHWADLSRIQSPAWAVAGARDPTYVRIARAMAAAGPLTPVVLPDAGHAIPSERPAALSDLLSALLLDA